MEITKLWRVGLVHDEMEIIHNAMQVYLNYLQVLQAENAYRGLLDVEEADQVGPVELAVSDILAENYVMAKNLRNRLVNVVGGDLTHG